MESQHEVNVKISRDGICRDIETGLWCFKLFLTLCYLGYYILAH